MSGLKLKLNTKPSSIPPPPSVPQTPQTPLATPGGSKIKLKFSANTKSARSSPAPPLLPAAPLPPPPPPVEIPKKTKAGRQSKPSAKILEQRKRKEPDTDEEDEIVVNVPNPPPKKLKLNVNGIRPGGGPASATPKTPAGGVILKAKVKGKPPKRIPGEGYDSEASDREIDPHIEEQFILRMEPGEDCDYLRQSIMDKKIGIPKAMGGADVYMKFFEGNGRRAAIHIRGRIYAATLVDLPCIIEGMKSWDKRGWWKSADICQMLLVYALVRSDDEAKTIALPDIIDQTTHQYPHGLTAPMHHARKRVFRKRMSKNAIEAAEAAVNRLLQADETALETRFDHYDPEQRESQAYSDQEEYSDDEEDAEGEDDVDQGYFNGAHGQGQVQEDQTPQAEEDDEPDEDFEAEFMAAFEDEPAPDASSTPMSSNNLPDSSNTLAAETPILHGEGDASGQEVDDGGLLEDSGDESAEDEDDDDEGDVDAKKQRQEQLDVAREDILELESQLAQQQAQLAAQRNPILKRRVEENIRKIKQELQLKKGAIEEDEGDA